MGTACHSCTHTHATSTPRTVALGTRSVSSRTVDVRSSSDHTTRSPISVEEDCSRFGFGIVRRGTSTIRPSFLGRLGPKLISENAFQLRFRRCPMVCVPGMNMTTTTTSSSESTRSDVVTCGIWHLAPGAFLGGDAIGEDGRSGPAEERGNMG